MTKELGRRIRAERTAKKMTQEELAERAGLHPTYIGQVERGEKSLTVAALKKSWKGWKSPSPICSRTSGRRRNLPVTRCSATTR